MDPKGGGTSNGSREGSWDGLELRMVNNVFRSDEHLSFKICRSRIASNRRLDEERECTLRRAARSGNASIFWFLKYIL